MTKEQREEF